MHFWEGLFWKTLKGSGVSLRENNHQREQSDEQTKDDWAKKVIVWIILQFGLFFRLSREHHPTTQES